MPFLMMHFPGVAQNPQTEWQKNDRAGVRLQETRGDWNLSVTAILFAPVSAAGVAKNGKT